jgi:rhodanese-related sulfurtransferase
VGGVVRAIWGFLVSLFKTVLRLRGEDEQALDDDTRAPGLREAGDDIAYMDRGLLEESDARRLCIAASLNNDFCQRLASKWRYFAFGERPQPIPSHRGPVEQPQPNKTGICCSGGGIRSAAFNLGALQALQESKQRELQRAHYLAAVSGGSYICAAYSMVGKTWGAPGAERPTNNPRHPYNGYDDSNPDLFEERATAFARNSPEEQYLRNRSSYMAPDGAAKIYLGLRVTLGLLFNVLFVGVPIAVGAILLGLLLYGPSLEGLLPKCSTKCGFHPTLALWLVPASLAALGAFVALVRIARRPPHDRARAVAEVWSTRLLVTGGAVALVTLVLPAIVGLLDHGLDGNKDAATPAGAAASVAGFAGMIAGLLAFARETVSSPAKAAKEVGAARSWLMKLSKPIRTLLINLAAWVAGPLLLFALAVLMVSVTLDNYRGHQTVLWLAAAGGTLVFLLTYIAADPTSLSLHPFYKRRLCTAFALKRVAPKEVGAERASAGIKQERREGVAVEREFDRLVPISKTALDKWPSLIVCAAANISDPGATPPGRSVTSFTFSANTIGGPLVGAMKTKKYERSLKKKRRRDLSLPAAVAMSGAAVSPSMGKESKPAFRFLLALANIRLGVWVPNPRWVARAAEDDKRFMRRPRLSYLVRELLGRNRVDGKYLYVTDGGHYENLGLVELLRRGCTRVFCFDASGGDKFSALGDAVALARSELGVKIEIDPTPLSPKGEPPTARRSTTTGWIHYPDGHKGYLVYSRNVMSPGGPWDVRAHQLDDPKFPHDSTADQLYTDKKFESYRALGAEAGVRAVARMQEVSPRPELPDERDPVDCGLPPQRVKDMLETAGIQLVDLRENFAYELEHIDGAMHIERGQLAERESELGEKFPVVFHCDEGLHSPAVAADYRKRNWQAFYIEGGIRRWIDDGLPVKGNGAAPASKGEGPPKAGATPADPAA